jgi:hypothetical protein
VSFTCTACGRVRAGSVPEGRQWCGGGSEPACEPAPLIPDHAESVRLVATAERIREMLSSWKKNTPRGEALCACLVLVGSEAGYEDAHLAAIVLCDDKSPNPWDTMRRAHATLTLLRAVPDEERKP